MTTYKTPGVKVQEISRLPFSVSQVKTSVPGFVGYTEFDQLEPIKISSMAEFEHYFGGPAPFNGGQLAGLGVSISTASGVTTVTNSAPLTANHINTMKLYFSMQLYFMNGGGPCWVVSTGPQVNTPSSGALIAGLDKLATLDEVTIIAVPDATALNNSTNTTAVYQHALGICNRLGDRMLLVDPVAFNNPVAGNDDSAIRGTVGQANLSYGAAYYPFLETTLPFPDRYVSITTHAGAGGGPDLSSYDNLESLRADIPTIPALAAFMAEFSNKLDAAIKTHTIPVPPSGAIAGIYCANDRNRGVWKAPANVSLRGIAQPTVRMNDALQGPFNKDDSDPRSINVIRDFTGKGTLVWGARTLNGDSPEWRYVPVQRLYMTVEKSLRMALAPVMFQPNDAITWARVKGMIENYLSGLWRQGALLGGTEQEAFFVKLGVGVTMTPAEAASGLLKIEIGMAAVRPAEFIILKFSHLLQQV
ncbi:MAG: phage tail sheath family protein [Salibacteraceae bacterium]